MIYTLTLNPSIDYYVAVDCLAEGTTMRTGCERMSAGGKGINVSLMLSNLQVESTAILCTAGFTGTEIERQLCMQGLRLLTIHLSEGNSRINVKIQSGLESEINGAGPEITDEAYEELMKRIGTLTSEDILIISGSMPASITEEQFENLLALLRENGAEFIADMTGDRLKIALKYQPLLVKPNRDELSAFFGVPLNKRADVKEYAIRLHKMGAKYVMVSLGVEGAVMVNPEGLVCEAEAPRGILRNSVGAGDSMVAGFVAGITEAHVLPGIAISDTDEDLLRFCVLCGSATAFSEGFATIDGILELNMQ